MKRIIQNRKIFIITFISTLIYLSITFLSNFGPTFFPPAASFFYFLVDLFLIPIILIFGLISLILLVIAWRKGTQTSELVNTGISLFLSFIILIPTIFIINRLIPDDLPTGSNTKEFDSSIWQSDSSSKWNNGISVREQMLKDVIKNILPGKTKQEIENVLGPSLVTGYFQSIDKDLIYYLGPERDHLFGIDSEWLLIWLDKDGKFKSYQIVND